METYEQIALPGVASLDVAAARLAARLDAVPVHAGGDLHTVRIVHEIEPVAPLTWLAAQRGTRCYWRSRDGALELAAIGDRRVELSLEAVDARTLPELVGDLACAEADLLGLLEVAFDPRRESFDGWPQLRPATLRLADLEVLCRGERAWLAANALPTRDGQVAEARAHLVAAAELPPAARPGCTPAGPGDVERDWLPGVQRILAAIDAGEIDKAVLARTAGYRLGGDASAFDLLGAIAASQPDTFHFAVELGERCALFAASPERLYRRRGRSIEAEALAGTRPRTGDAEADARFERELRASDKERREHASVREHIAARLGPLCTELRGAEAPEVQRLANVLHLRTPYRGTLCDGVTDLEVLAALHPTPAVCGRPTGAARALLADCEAFDRGLYGGVVGVVGHTEAELAVVLRCGRLRGRDLTLFAGAGIVAGSDPRAEWEETNGKLRAFSALLDPPA